MKKILVYIIIAICLVSCNEGDPTDQFPPSQHGLAYSGWKLSHIEPDGCNMYDSNGYTIQFDAGQCSGKGNINSFYAGYFYCNPSASYLLISMSWVSNNGYGGDNEKKYFDYISKATNYEFIGDSILILYPFPSARRFNLVFKKQWAYFYDGSKISSRSIPITAQ